MSTIIAKHFVTFYSPGTFVAETTEKPIDAWDIKQATEMARSVLERYNAAPYGFRFSTRSRGPEDLDSRVTATSPFYWLGGTVETQADVEARATDKERILLSNMRSAGPDAKIITNTNSWRWTSLLGETDVVLDFTPAPATTSTS